ncbi:YceI family protein [Dinoroseobacter sp. S76]|uniref:YceI family protein n=1 Tax=Dinoroseobacter sp. S76 TaxID=3415124 RepID=UPI003C7C0700
MKRRVFLCSALVWPLAAQAAPVRYQLAPKSEVEFTFFLAGAPSRGRMPILDADLRLDFRRVSASRVAVTLDAAGARTNLPLANGALKGPSILDTARFPQIRYTSTAVRAQDGGAAVSGNLALRDRTQPVALAARFFRQPDRDPGDLSRLVIELRGELSRSAFGATGFADLVADRIELRCLATIDRIG